MAEFTHLHLHTHYSLLDSVITIDELADAAYADKMEAVAITDHGNLFGALEFYTALKEKSIKPILGCEVYLSPGGRHLRGNHASGDEDLAPYSMPRSGLNHLILLCMNDVGYLNLCKLVSVGFLEGFYYKPRIDKEILAKHSEGLIATSACFKGEVTSAVLRGDMDKARELALAYKEIFQGRFYLELQNNGVPQQMMVNSRFMEMSCDLDIPLVATADCHYLKKEQAQAHEVLMAIQTGKTLDESSSGFKSDEFYFKPQSVMKEEFSFCPEAIANTQKIASQCNFEFKFTDDTGRKIYHFPKFEAPEKQDPSDYLRMLSQQGLEKRYSEIEARRTTKIPEEEKTQYQHRLDRELKVIIDMGFTGYFLIVSDFIQYAKHSGIPVGPGRGSGAGSLVAYALGITDLDPLEHSLIFERFLNPERVSLPDFDVDFCMEKRDLIIQYVSNKYGKDCVAQIITFGKLQARGVTRDVGRTLGMIPQEVDKIAKLIPETLNITLKDAFEQEPRLRALTEKDPQIHRLFELCKELEGLNRHASIHAAGLVISNRPMVEHCPLYRGKNNELVIQFDMNQADKIGLIKFDFLGLKTLTFLQRAEALIQQRYPEAKFSLGAIPFYDAKTYEMLAKGDTLGVFQLESSGMQDLMRKIVPDNFEDIVASNALYRPGPLESGMVDDYIARKHGRVAIQYDFEELKSVLQDTYGVIVYQEQVQQIAMKLASYTAGSADLLRRAMGKKKPEEMAKQKAIFVEGAVKNGFDPQKIDRLFELMAKFAGYGFNKSHASAYSLITCQTAFIKAHYPVEFFAALLSIERENTDKITKYIADAAKRGISILRPDVNESETDFTILSKSQIRFGLGAIKGVGQIAIDSVLEARKQNGHFKDLLEVCSRTNPRTVNKRVLEAFVKAGALDSLHGNRAALMKVMDEVMETGSMLHKVKDDNQSSFLDLMGAEDLQLQSRTITYPDEPPWEKSLELKYEKETMGIYLTGHPLGEFEEEIQKYTTMNIEQCLQQTSPKEVFVAGMVASLREIQTRKNERMAFATLQDKENQIDVVIFSDIYLETEHLWKSQDALWVRGSVEAQGTGNNKIILSKKSQAKVLPLRFAFEALAREIHIVWSVEKIEAQTLESKLSILKETLGHLGQGGVNLNVPKMPTFLRIQAPKAATVLKLTNSVPLHRDAVQSIHSLFNPGEVRVEFR